MPQTGLQMPPISSWWKTAADGSWLRWNHAAGRWEPDRAGPPPPVPPVDETPNEAPIRARPRWLAVGAGVTAFALAAAVAAPGLLAPGQRRLASGPPPDREPTTTSTSDGERTIYDDIGDFSKCFGDSYSLIGKIARNVEDTPGLRDDVGRIARGVATMRGLRGGKAPKAVFLTREEIGRRAAGSVDHSYSASDARLDGELLFALGAADKAVDAKRIAHDLIEDEVLGFYSPESKTLYASADRGRLRLLDEVVLAHEIAHALVDRRIGLPELEADLDSDEQLARRSLLEGDANLAAVHYLMGTRTPEQLAAAGTALAEIAGDQTGSASGAPYLMRRLLAFPYEEGLAFVCGLYERGGWKAVNAAYERPAASTAEILFPDRYGERDDVVELRRAPSPGRRWTHARRDVVGAADLLTLFESPGGVPPETKGERVSWVAAWQGGRLDIWTHDGGVAVAMTIADRRGGAMPSSLCDRLATWHEESWPDGVVFEERTDATLWRRRGGFSGIACGPGLARFVYAPAKRPARLLAGKADPFSR